MHLAASEGKRFARWSAEGSTEEGALVAMVKLQVLERIYDTRRN
jgi:hypothetical protein